MNKRTATTGAQQRKTIPSTETVPAVSGAASVSSDFADREAVVARKPSIRIRVVYGNIGEIGRESREKVADRVPIDAVAVGHYERVGPVDAEKALDEAISGVSAKGSEPELIITRLTERGIISSVSPRPFFLPDPRHPGRVIVVGCMGYFGQFAACDLILLASQICWSLGVMGKKHLTSVLIGAGNGNLAVDRAVEAWIRGLALALTQARSADQQLHALTFVEYAPERIKEIHGSLTSAARSAQEIHADVMPLAASDAEQAEKGAMVPKPRGRREPLPVRVIAKLPRKSLYVSVMSDKAVAPDRELPLEPQWIFADNDRLTLTDTDDDQQRKGFDLFRQLVPKDFRPHLFTPAPVITVCDSQAAQIAWEMLAQLDAANQAPLGAPAETIFLGLARGLTRQLLTPATPREYHPTGFTTFRVLIVADPAADRRLVGASDEGEAVRQMFENYKQKVEASSAGRTVEIESLVGPDGTSSERVMEKLSEKPYDILHFAGHGDYSSRRPGDSGWVFSNGKRLTAADLRQIEAVPRFVFANACASGNMPAGANSSTD